MADSPIPDGVEKAVADKALAWQIVKNHYISSIQADMGRPTVVEITNMVI